MKAILLILVLVSAIGLASRVSAGGNIDPAEAARRVAGGEAVLIDVREPAEWEEGVARPALLLPLSDLRGDRRQWKAALKQHRGRELILYCRSGNRSGIAARLLEKEGFRTTNAGGFADWRDAGLPVRRP